MNYGKQPNRNKREKCNSTTHCKKKVVDISAVNVKTAEKIFCIHIMATWLAGGIHCPECACSNCQCIPAADVDDNHENYISFTPPFTAAKRRRFPSICCGYELAIRRVRNSAMRFQSHITFLCGTKESHIFHINPYIPFRIGDM